MSPAQSIAPELVFLILSHVRHPRDTLPDRPHVLPTLRALPLVCKSWHQPATEILYQRILFSSPSSRQSKLLIRTIQADPGLGELVTVLCFPDLRFRPCDYYRNERSSVRLHNYTQLIALCPNLIFLRLPTNLQNALSPRALPAVPLLTAQTENLLSLHLTASFSSDPVLSFLPIHLTLPSLLHLTLANFSFAAEHLPPASRLLFPSLPRLRSLTLSACLFDARAATQLFTALQPSLTHLELWHSGYLPDLPAAALAVLGPTLHGLVLDQPLHPWLPLAQLPALTSLKLAADALAPALLRALPPRLARLRVTALPPCPCSPAKSRDSLGAALASALAEGDDDNDDDALPPQLAELVIAGRCCAWHRWDALLDARCAARGITLVRDTAPGECADARTPLRRRIDSLASWPRRRAGAWWHRVADRVSY